MFACLSRFAFFVIAVLLTAAIGSGAEPKSLRAAAESSSGVSPEARAAIERVLKDGRLSLSMGRDSFADRFEFVFTLMLPAKEGLGAGGSYWVARDKAEMAAAVFSPRGEAVGYATKRFLGVLEPGVGRLLVCEEGAPTFAFGVTASGAGLDSELSFARDAAESSVNLHLGPLIEGALRKAVRGDYNPKERAVRLVTPKSDVSVILAARQAADAFPIEGIAIASKAGLAVVLSDIRTGGERPRILGLDKSSFQRAELPMRIPNDKATKIPLLVPPDFGSAAADKRAVEALQKVLPPLPTTGKQSQGTPQTKPAVPSGGV
jgi:hypothetical protein